MDHVTYLEKHVEFIPFRYEHILLFPQQNRKQLEHVWLELNSMPNVFVSGNRPMGSCPSDVRLYVDGVDITPSVIKALRLEIASHDDTMSEYRSAVTSYIKLGEALGGAFPGDLDDDRKIAETLLETEEPETLLDQLGNPSAGWGGNLHIFNFLYDHISIQPISMWKVLEYHNQSGSEALDVKTSPHPKLTVSMGPCRFFDASFDPTNVPRGGIKYRLTMSYHNPLDEQVNELEKRIERLKKKILKRLNGIVEAVDDGGRFQLELAGLKKNVALIQSELTQVSTNIDSNRIQAEGLKAQVKALHDAVSIL